MEDIESQVHSALTRLHPPLADLYMRGVEFAVNLSRPGQVHLLAHIGREISRSLLHIISRELPVEVIQAEDDPEAAGRIVEGQPREEMPRQIGAALGLRHDHPVVRAWYRIHGDLVGRAHVSEDPTPLDPSRVISAFRQLTKLMWSRLSPYFTTEDELTSLLSRHPVAEDLETLYSLFLRPRLRYRFFALCDSPEWVEHLDSAGFFSHAPGAPDPSDEAQRIAPWPEGTALVNVATMAPDLVTRIIKARLPLGNTNPLVWDSVCRAIELLPVEQAGALIPQLNQALRVGGARYAAPASLNVVKRLVEAGSPKALGLFGTILGLRTIPVVDDTKDYRRMSPPTYSLLERVDDYYVEKVLNDVLPIVAQYDSCGVVRLLVGRLDRAEFLLTQAGYGDADYSHHWLSEWNGSGHGRDDLRADLARAVDRVAKDALTAAPDLFHPFSSLIPDNPSHIMQRLRLRFMIAAGPIVAGKAINQVIASDWALEPEFGAREVADLLRRHFGSASEQAKTAFVRRLEAGPSDERIRSHCEWTGQDPNDLTSRTEYVSRWQATRLRWFQEELPDEFRPLAARIGHTPVAVDHQRQDLDEVGHWSSGAVWAGDQSPKSVDELRGMSTREIVDFLANWRPAEAERFDGPNRRGLADRLRQLLSEIESDHGALLHQLSTRGSIDPVYQSAALAACSEVIKGAPGEAFPWSETLTLVRAVVAAEPTESTEDRTALWARREGLRCLVEACRSGMILSGLWDEVASIIDLAVDSVPSWGHFAESEYLNFDSVGSAALNTDAGAVADLIATSCRVLDEVEGADAKKCDVTISQWLDAAVSWGSSHGVSARWQIGRHLPKLLHYMDDWVGSHEEDLLGSGMTDPVSFPTWGAYLTSYGLYHNLYERLEPWYRAHVRSVDSLREWESEGSPSRDDLNISRHMLEHIGMALLRGLIRFDVENDAELRAVFATASGTDRAHFAWLVMRVLDDAEGPLQVGFEERVITFWQWRLDVLAEWSGEDDLKEIDALGWFIRIEQLEPEAIIDHVLRTLEVNSTVFSVRGHVWTRLPAFVECDPMKAVTMTEHLVDATLAGEFPYVDFAEVSPVLIAILASGSTEAVMRATTLVNRLGEAGWSEFRKLLD